MKTHTRLAFFLTAFLLFTLSLHAQENLSSSRRTVDYDIRDSVDNFGNSYIHAWCELPSVMTFLNTNGSVTVCTSDENEKVTYIYEYNANLAEQKTLSFKNEFAQLGAFTKDGEGNYYFFYAKEAAKQDTENMAVVKYDKTGEKVKTYTLKALPPRCFGGIKIPFRAGTCRLELSGSMLAVYFAREMFNGHQASYGFVLDKDTFERIDRGAMTNAEKMGGREEMPYTSHSFNQFILPIDNGFIFADHGDAYPRSFTFARFLSGESTKRIHAFTFPGSRGTNATYGEMGGVAKTSIGYIFTGAYGKDINTARNLFVLTINDDITKCSSPIYVTKYTRDNGHAGHPKIAALGNDHYLLLWERFQFSAQSANSLPNRSTGYLSTYMLIINEKGEAVSEPKELEGIRLNMNDALRYNPQNKKAYWAINDTDTSITVYALDIN